MGDAHTMTSLNRPTSRVLAPPGGGSSNIFGTDAPTTIESKTKAAARHQQSSSIFGGQPEKQAAQPPKTQPHREDPFVSSQDGIGTRTVQKPSPHLVVTARFHLANEPNQMQSKLDEVTYMP